MIYEAQQHQYKQAVGELVGREVLSPFQKAPFPAAISLLSQDEGTTRWIWGSNTRLSRGVCSQPIFCCHRSTDTEWEFFCSSHFCPSHFDYQASVNIRSQNTRSIGPLFRSLKQSHGTHRNMQVVASHLRRRQGLCKLVSCHPLITHTYISLIKAAFLNLY